MKLTPKYRSELLNALETLAKLVGEAPVQGPCTECEHVGDDKAHPYCRKWERDIPAGVVLVGCDAFEYMPF